MKTLSALNLPAFFLLTLLTACGAIPEAQPEAPQMTPTSPATISADIPPEYLTEAALPRTIPPPPMPVPIVR